MRWAWFFAGTTVGTLLLAAWLVAASPAATLSVPAQLPIAPTATVPVKPTLAPPVQAPDATATPAAAARAAPTTPGLQTVKRGQVVASADWQILVHSSRLEERNGAQRVVVDWTVKNNGRRADVVSIPSTAEAGPRVRPADFRPIQLGGPPRLELRLVDTAERFYGGGFVGANGETGGGFTFLAAPGDAIRFAYAFDVPRSASGPLLLEVGFGLEAGGKRFRIDLDDRLEPPATLLPSDPPSVAGKDQRLEAGGLWAFTLLGIEVGAPGRGGERVVTARVRAENRGDVPLPLGASVDDPTGQGRDFFVVDAEARLAYSSADSMPMTPILPGRDRVVEIRMRAPSEFASSGPMRFTIVVDTDRDRYAVFKLP